MGLSKPTSMPVLRPNENVEATKQPTGIVTPACQDKTLEEAVEV